MKAKIKNIIGKKIILVFMYDKSSPPPGSVGEILNVDSNGSLLIKWDDGSSLNIIPEIDLFILIK